MNRNFTGTVAKGLLCVLLAFSLVIPSGIAYRNGDDIAPEKERITLGNLLPNPSFEEGGDKPTGWDHKAMCGTGKYLWNSDYSHEGKKSVGMLNIVGGCSDSAYWYTLDMVPVDPRNHTYTASVWYKFRGEKERCPSSYLRIVAYDKDKYYLSTLEVPCPYEDNDWHYAGHDYDASNDSSQTLPVDACYVKISLCGIVEWNQNADAEVRFDSVFFGVREHINNPPEAPDISGPSSGSPGEEYSYNFVSTDPEGDDVYYRINWGDNSSDTIWYGPYASGEAVAFTHTWENMGNYTISAVAKDVYNAQSEWGVLGVTMPIFYGFHLSLMERVIGWIIHAIIGAMHCQF
ncbi:MAG TPA: hypothetical protein ENL18_01805 [Thermoplasmatales archaeon]|nr:hypothetical protein [Thermoplasmatales archaeon]